MWQLIQKQPYETVVYYDSLREQTLQIDKNYPYSMLILFMILIRALRPLVIGTRTTVFFNCKCKNVPIHSKTSFILWHKENPKETKAILSGSPQQTLYTYLNKV